MASKKRERKGPAEPSPSATSYSWDYFLARPGTIFAGLALAVFLFYFKPLFSANASIQWDAVDVQYSAQNHLSEMLHAGRLPLWTPYVYSGMPFLADPQVGAWYPLNWPFLLAGITPRAIEWELALHCLMAAIGGYLLARDLLSSGAAPVFAGVFFAFSGVFAEHSSHPGIFQTSSLLPWLLWTGRRSAREARWLPALGIAAGVIVLAGHFQTALYAFFALAIFLAADAAMARDRLRGTAVALLAAAAAGMALSAVMVLPGLELTAESIRAGADYSKDAGASLTAGALATLVIPDHYGALNPERYTGPPDITQFYLYMGILLVPLALLGAAMSRERWYGLALAIPGVWYAMGPAGGLYSAVALVPGFRSVRAPVHMWFVAALGLALLAAAGVGVLRARFRPTWIALALLAITGVDLYYSNMERNGLAYARERFEDRYGSLEERFRTAAAPVTANRMHRIWAATASPGFGPLNGSLDNRMEVTFGYNPLELSRYAQYLEAAQANPKLLNGLAVTAALNAANGTLSTNPAALPRIYAPEAVSAAPGRAAAAARLGSLDPAHEAVAEGIAAIERNGGAKVRITGYDGNEYRAEYEAEHETLLRIAVPYFPGWRAEVDGRAVRTAPVDVALVGVVVPAGRHELTVHYRSTWLATAAAISGLAWLGMGLWLWRGMGRGFRRN